MLSFASFVLFMEKLKNSLSTRASLAPSIARTLLIATIFSLIFFASSGLAIRYPILSPAIP